MKKKKILWLSDSPTTTTGFATITRNILNLLKDDFECHCLGHNYIGQTLVPPIIFDDGEKIDFFLHGAGRSKFAIDAITRTIRKYKIDIFGGLLDTFMLMEGGFMNCDTSPAHTFWYYPSDGGGGLPITCDNILRKVEIPIAMSKFAKEQVKKVHDINSVYIPHAYDPKLFYKLSSVDKEKIRMKWMLKNKFVVGTVARNQGRKMLDRTVKAFAIFCRNKSNAILLMHTDKDDMCQVFNINELIQRYKLRNRILFTGTTFYEPLGYTQMNEIYNLMDIFFLSTSGEGFGVPIIEAMACGVPQVVTDYTTTKELVMEDGQSGESVLLAGEKEACPSPHTNEVLDGTHTGSWNVERGVMSVYDAVEKLNKLYNDASLREKYSKVGLAKARKYYTWDIVIPLWKEVLNKMV